MTMNKQTAIEHYLSLLRNNHEIGNDFIKIFVRLFKADYTYISIISIKLLMESF